MPDATAPTLDAFAHVERGDDAPAWVRDGVAAAWGLGQDARVTLIVLSENVTFRVAVAGVPVMVVRLGRPGYAASTDHIRSELVWVDALKTDAGISTPAPVRGIDDDFVQFVVDEGGAAWSAVAFGFVSGTMLEDQPDAELPQHFVEIGRVTALLHEHARAWGAPDGFVRFAWQIPDCVGAGARWGDWRAAALSPLQRRTLEGAEARAIATLDELGVAPGGADFGLIHGDLRPSNVMITGDEVDPLVVIDFDDCGYGYYLYDFAAAITFYEHRPAASVMAGNWLAGYERVRPLGERELRAANALSMIRRLTMLGWATTHREDALPPDLWNENLPGTVEVGARFLADPEWLTR